MNVKKIVSIAAATLMTTGVLAIAGPGDGAHCGVKSDHAKQGHMGEKMNGHMAEKMNLSDAQQTQMKGLKETFHAENQSLMDAMKQTREELRAARKANDTARAASLAATAEQQRADLQKRREAQHERMLEILTPEQRTQMEQMHQTMKERGERGVKKQQMKKNQAREHAHQSGSTR